MFAPAVKDHLIRVPRWLLLRRKHFVFVRIGIKTIKKTCVYVVVRHRFGGHWN